MDLQSALKERGHRQRDLAQRLGVPESTVSRWMAWARDRDTGIPIPAEALAAVAEMTGIEPAQLLLALARPAPQPEAV